MAECTFSPPYDLSLGLYQQRCHECLELTIMALLWLKGKLPAVLRKRNASIKKCHKNAKNKLYESA